MEDERKFAIQTAITNAVVKQAIVRSGKSIGSVMIASGSEMLVRKEPFVTKTITGKYTPAMGMTANEIAMSEARYELFESESRGDIKKVGDRGRPLKTERFTTTTELTRARVKPTWFTPGGKVVVDPKGPDFLQSVEDFESREKRQSKYRRKARMRIAGGAVLRYGIAPAMYIYGIHSLYSRYKTEDIWMQEEATDAYGPYLGPVLAAGADVILAGGLAPLPTGTIPDGGVTSLPIPKPELKW